MTGGIDVSVDLSEVERLLAKLDAGSSRVAQTAARETANEVANRARVRLPRRTGRLASSVSVVGVEDGAAVSVSTPYAGWIEYGGSRGRPFVSGGRYVGPSAEGAEERFAAHAVDGLDRLLR